MDTGPTLTEIERSPNEKPTMLIAPATAAGPAADVGVAGVGTLAVDDDGAVSGVVEATVVSAAAVDATVVTATVVTAAVVGMAIGFFAAFVVVALGFFAFFVAD